MLTLEFEIGRGYFQSSDGIEGQDSGIHVFFSWPREAEGIHI